MQQIALVDLINASTDFCFTFAGRIEADGEVQRLINDQAVALQVIPPLEHHTSEQRLWHLLPMINSDGTISSVRVLESSSLKLGQYYGDECVLTGRVLQVSKRSSVVLFSVELPTGKLLKITLTNPDPRTKANQEWLVTAKLEDNKLQITEAIPLSPVEEPKLKSKSVTLNTTNSAITAEPELNTTNNSVIAARSLDNQIQSPQAIPSAPTVEPELESVPEPVEPDTEQSAAEPSKLVLANPAPPAAKAILTLELETGTDGWELVQTTERKLGWEWEAVNLTTSRKARVSVSAGQYSVYEYKLNAATPIPNDTDTERLAVTALGAARGIGASCFQVDIGPYEVVLDCGTRPKGSNPLPALEYLKNPNLCLISHSHQDHIGGLPIFHTEFPAAPMVCTPGTREIAHTMLTDCLKVQQNEDSEPLFDELELKRTLFHLKTQPIGQDFEPLPGLKVRFINAGHIVGAACIYLRYGDRSLLYTGDYNTASSRTTTGLQLTDLPSADILITESTYGDSSHPSRKTQETALLSAIAEVVQSGGNVLIPAFALGRAQEILLALRTSSVFQKLDVPIYVNGLVRAVTDTFRDNLDLLPSAVQNMVRVSAREPFTDENSKPTVIPISKPQQRPLAMAKPSVIIASSGMLNGGASVYYAKTLLERDNAAIFISGYTDEEAPGRKIQALQTGDEIELDGQKVTVRAQIKRFNLSAHVDRIGLGQVISRVNPKHLVLVHGSLDALHELARSGDLRDKYFVHIPEVGEKMEYGVAPAYLNEHQIARLNSPQEFEVEVVETKEGAWIRIPESVVESDPRWQILAANGVLKAKWGGVGLKLFAATEQKLEMEKAKLSAIESRVDCCAKCQYFEQDTNSCGSVDSPLSGRVVDPSGYCLEYIAPRLLT